MECLRSFGITSMRDDTTAPLSGRGELHGGARVLTLVAEKVYLKLHKRNKMFKCYSQHFLGQKRGLYPG